MFVALKRQLSSYVVKDVTAVDFRGRVMMGPDTHEVVGFLVHFGTTVASGHFVCYVRHRQADDTFAWFCTSDKQVSGPLQLSLVFTPANFQNVYMILYSKVN